MANVPSLLPIPRLPAEITRSLSQLTEQRMLSPARAAGYELRLVGATVYPQRQTIARTSQGAWLFVDHWVDPTADKDGKLRVPPDQLARLHALGRLTAPNLLFIGHQLPDSYRDGDPIPQLVPAPRHLREKDERLTQRLKWGTELFVKGSGAVLALAAAAPLVVGGAAVGALGAGLDPIVFGGVVHPQYPAVQWVVLADWVWE